MFSPVHRNAVQPKQAIGLNMLTQYDGAAMLDTQQRNIRQQRRNSYIWFYIDNAKNHKLIISMITILVVHIKKKTIFVNLTRRSITVL